MKTIALALILMLVPAAYGAEVMRCDEMQSYVPKEDGSGTIEPSGLTIVVNASRLGQRGWTADLIHKGSTIVEKDVDVGRLTDTSQAREIAAIVAPHIRWSDVAAVRFANVGVKANLDDSAGIIIFELLGRQNQVLIRITKVGWGLGICVTSPPGSPQQSLEPKNFCHQGCSEQQQRIWQAFEQAQFQMSAPLPALYSGECYHLSRSYNPAHAHYGVFYTSAVGEATHFSGRFNFFSPANPYADFQLGTAAQDFPAHDDPKRASRMLVRSSLVDFSSKETPWRYWLRHSEDMKTLYVTGQWGFFHFLFCEMKKH